MSVDCPKCGTPIGVEAVAKLEKESQMCFALSPAPGEYMSADHIGGVLTNFAKLMKAMNKEHGVKASTIVRNIQTEADGTIKFNVTIVRIK